MSRGGRAGGEAAWGSGRRGERVGVAGRVTRLPDGVYGYPVRVSPIWLVCAVLLGGAAFFSAGVARKRAAATPALAVKTGDLVTLVAVVDGDSIVVKNAQGSAIQVRILGIKSFDARSGQDGYDQVGTQAATTLHAMLDNEPFRVVLGDPPRDANGRTLATLLLHDKDVGLELIQRGLALTYTPYSFPAIQTYLRAQNEARVAKIGLWASPTMVERVDKLIRSWSEQAP